MASRLKAILEIDVPESCSECPFRKTFSSMRGGQSSISLIEQCFISAKSIKDFSDTRAPFCPLKIKGVNDDKDSG